MQSTNNNAIYIAGTYSTEQSINLVVGELERTLDIKFDILSINKFMEEFKKGTISLEENYRTNFLLPYVNLAGNRKPLVVAHSFGGLLATQAAKEVKPSMQILTAPAVNIINIKQLILAYKDKKSGKYDTDMIDTTTEQALDDRVDKLLNDMKPYSKHWLLFNTMARRALKAAPQIECPTLILQGTKDLLVRPKGSKKLAMRIPNSEYTELQGFGHSLLKSKKANQALRKIKSFVNGSYNNNGAIK